MNKRSGKKKAYYAKINSELLDGLQEDVLQILVGDKRYCEKDISCSVLANELQTNTRYLSALFRLRFKCSFNMFVNRLRVEEAMRLLSNRQYADVNVEDIGYMVGFSSRQSFYNSFDKIADISPLKYKRLFIKRNLKSN